MTMKQCRELRKLSVTDMAERLDISNLLYEYYENHSEDVSLDIAVKFATQVSISLDEIFFTSQSN